MERVGCQITRKNVPLFPLRFYHWVTSNERLVSEFFQKIPIRFHAEDAAARREIVRTEYPVVVSVLAIPVSLLRLTHVR